MAAVDGDIFYGLTQGTYLGQLCQNRYWYRYDGGNTTQSLSGILATHLINGICQAIKTELSNQFNWDLCEAYLWKNPTQDFLSQPLDIDGEASLAQPLPSYVCITFRSPKPVPGLRYGFKRYSGLSEAQVNGNNIPLAGAFQDVQEALGQTLTTTDGLLAPVLVDTRGASYTSGKFPPVGGLINPIPTRLLTGDWIWRLGTQNSRKAGVGA